MNLHPQGVAMIWAQNPDRVIGQNGKMPWHIPGDLAHFKTLTTGQTVIMGRATWESLGSKPLPNRINIVVTQDSSVTSQGAWQATSLLAAIRMSPEDRKVFLIGGQKILEEGMQFADELFVTHVEIPDLIGHAFAPRIPLAEFGSVHLPLHNMTEHGVSYSFAHYSRKATPKLA